MSERELILETKQLCKTFGPTKALNKVDIKIYRGEITGLIGENGSGKSTITSIIAGMQPPGEGEIYYKGSPHKPATMLEAAKAGIGMIVQEQGYVPGITIAQNIFLGNEGRFGGLSGISAAKMNRAAKDALERIGFHEADPAAYIDRLDLQDRKLVEIARVMYADPEILVVDETTTSLSQKGRDILYSIMRRMREDNKAVIFITHDLGELMEICDTLTVLRDGQYIATLAKEEMNEDAIKRLIVGREVGDSYYRTDYDGVAGSAISRAAAGATTGTTSGATSGTTAGTTTGATSGVAAGVAFGGVSDTPAKAAVLEGKNLTSAGGLLMNFSFTAYKGEILGVGGLSHCGMHELGRVLFGAEKLLTGSVTHVGSGKPIKDPATALSVGMGYVSKDRDRESLIPIASIRDNIVMAGLDKLKGTGGFILPKAQDEYVNEQVRSLSIKCASIQQNVQYLSGGNKQKVAFGKWLARGCDILILDCPTRGVDIGVKAAMYALMYEMKQSGKTVIMISEELAELIGMSDRLLILKDGHLAGEFARSPELTEQQIVEIMI